MKEPPPLWVEMSAVILARTLSDKNWNENLIEIMIVAITKSNEWFLNFFIYKQSVDKIFFEFDDSNFYLNLDYFQQNIFFVFFYLYQFFEVVSIMNWIGIIVILWIHPNFVSMRGYQNLHFVSPFFFKQFFQPKIMLSNNQSRS